MQIIILSGGSGQRLWPLSNDARSKQFLHLLAAPGGGKESMLERVARQIGQSPLRSAGLTVATNLIQRDSIVNQLGEGTADIVTEPERRDTFPAIALAAAHLVEKRGCERDEAVVVIPCDVFADDSYFAAAARMAQAAERGEAELVLMGAKPKCATDEFGYILPNGSDRGREVQRVERFVEKPGKEEAESLIDGGALWNCGVFAFRLGYIMDRAAKYLPAGASCADMTANYASMPAISFDYEVTERAENVAVVPYAGKWKDLGTWNALCEELPSTHVGNVCMGTECRNTHAVNELGIPVFVNGVSDAVIAASPDGILVCGKSESEQIKDYTAQLTARPMYEERRWGTYRVLDNTTYPDGLQSLTKSITLKAGKSISYQIHHHRSEVWTIADGEGVFVLDGERRRVGRGDVLVIEQEHYHAIRAVTDLVFIEVQMGSPLIEEDIERFAYEWE